MKKIVLFLLLIIVSFPLFAVGNTEKKENNTVDYTEMSLKELKSEIKTVVKGKLTIATSPDFAPYEFYSINSDKKPVLSGFDISLAYYIADYLGLEADIIPMDFDGTIMELQNKSVDLGISGYSPAPERENTMDFSDIYFSSEQAFVCLKSNESKFRTISDTNNKNYSIAVQIGSIQAGLAQKYSPDSDIISLSKVTDIIAELISGKITGAYIEKPVAEYYIKNYPQLCIVLDVPYDSEGSVIGISKGNHALREGVNRAIAQVLSDGTMVKFIEEANNLASGDIYEGII